MIRQVELSEELTDLIRKGPLTEVYQGEEAWALAEAISANVDAIRDSIYDSLCGRLQLLLADHLTLAVTRVFESHDRYDTRGVPDVLDFLETHADRMEILEAGHLRKGLERWDSPPPVRRGCDGEINRGVVRFLRSQTPQPERVEESTHSMALWKARRRRNKRIAHNEAYELSEDEKASWYELVRLLRLARDIMAPVSMGYGSLVFAPQPGEFVMQSDAEANARRFLDLLAEAGVIDSLEFNRAEL